MSTFRLLALALIVLTAGAKEARADVWSPYVTIVNVTQSNGDRTLFINTYPTINTTLSGCSNTTLYVQDTNGLKPGYNSLAPYIMAAFLYNKQVSFNLTNGSCAFSGADPIVGGITVQQ